MSERGETSAAGAGPDAHVEVTPEQVLQPTPPDPTPIATAPEHSFFAPIMGVLVISSLLLAAFIAAVAGIWILSLLRLR